MLKDDLQNGKYLDFTYRMVSNQPHSTSGGNCDNYWLFTAQARELGYEDESLISFYVQSTVKPGLFHRFPGRTDDVSQDEIIGAAVLSRQIASDILYFGDHNWWVFNAANYPKLELKYWIGRFVNVRPFVKHCANVKMNIFDQAMWSIGCFLSCFAQYGDTSGKLLMWTQIKKVQGNYLLCDAAIAFWKFKMGKMYKGGEKELRKIYFGEKHPLVQYSADTFQ